MADIKVEITDYMGSDLKVCQMAKDSFGRTTDWEYWGWATCGQDFLDAENEGYIQYNEGPYGSRQYYRLSGKDQNLLKMLARGMGESEYQETIDTIGLATSRAQIEAAMWKFRHTTPHIAPFGHNFATFKFQAPVFVMRQIVKHEYIRISELSMRYVRGMPEYFRPKSWRSVARDVKQGSGGDLDVDGQDWFDLKHDMYFDADNKEYLLSLSRGLAPEQARMFLRLCHMTQGHLSGSMDALAGLVIKRLDPHAQEETREFARQIDNAMSKVYPLSWAALMEGVERN